MKKPLTYKQFKQIYSKVPRLCVEVIIQTDKGIVLSKRSIPPYKGMWHIPGGTVFHKEYLEDAVARVAKNEVGVEVKINKFLGFIYYPEVEKEYNWSWAIGAAFLTEITSGEPKGSEQGEEIKYFKKLPKNIIPPQAEFLRERKLI